MLVSHYAGAHLDQFQRVVVDPASVSVVHIGDGVPRILLVNDTGSLDRFAAITPKAANAAVRVGRGGRGRKLRG
jgi:hypothetical protein